MWKLKEVDFDRKEKLSKMKVLESLVARGEGLPAYEEDLKKRLIVELM